MDDNRPSIQRIIDAWSDRYANRFPTAQRKAAIIELIEDLVANGYDRGQIERSKAKVIEEMVGPRSPFGAQALKDWKVKANKDFDKSVRAAFEHIPERTGPVKIPFTPAVMTDTERAEQDKADAVVLKELNESLTSSPINFDADEETSDIEQEDLVFDDKPVIRPEMDRSRFADVQTTEIMSDEDFFAMLEREKNEQ